MKSHESATAMCLVLAVLIVLGACAVAVVRHG